MKKRDFLGYATVTDYLIAQGVTFHPETVILQVDDIDTPELPISHSEAIQGKCRPLFKYQTIEQILNLPQLPLLGRLIYIVSDIETQTAAIIAFNATAEMIITGSSTLLANFNDDGTLCQDDALGEYISLDEVNLTIPNHIQKFMTDPFLQEDAVFALTVFHIINEGYDIEEVEFPRNYRRRHKKKTGKLPSNHYTVRTIKRTRKRYQPSGNGTQQGKRPEHLVRGHFRHVTDHPLQQFNGDWWIPAHTRGGNSDKPKSKPIYRIEL